MASRMSLLTLNRAVVSIFPERSGVFHTHKLRHTGRLGSQRGFRSRGRQAPFEEPQHHDMVNKGQCIHHIEDIANLSTLSNTQQSPSRCISYQYSAALIHPSYAPATKLRLHSHYRRPIYIYATIASRPAEWLGK